MLKHKGKIWKATGESNAHVVYISSLITQDSAYPFKAGENVQVEVDVIEKKIIITKKEESYVEPPYVKR